MEVLLRILRVGSCQVEKQCWKLQVKIVARMCLQAIQGDTVKAQKSQSKYTAVQECCVVLFNQ